MLRDEMNNLTAYVSDMLARQTDGDKHLTVCHAAADKFELWEADGDGERFPLWLSFVVGGIGRDLGILD